MAALPLEEELQTTTEKETGLHVRDNLNVLEKKASLVPSGNLTPNRPSRSVVIVATIVA
jgi:hypothetical protein